MVVLVPPIDDGVAGGPTNQAPTVTMVPLCVPAPGGPLAYGVHLRWMFDPNLGFPTYGFDIFRRDHRPGVPQTLDLSGITEGAFGRQTFIGPIEWSNVQGPTAQVISVSTPQGSTLAVQPGGFASTVRLGASEAPARRIEIDVVHWNSGDTLTLSVWGISGNHRVTQTNVDLTSANQGQTLTLVLKADALDGFQVFHASAALYGVVGLRWTRCSSESKGDWGAPLNAQRIGLPVTAPGYAVPTAYGPDPGDGHLDWQAAADRLSPTGNHVDLPPGLAQRFGPPVFDGTRDLMRRALAGQPIETPAAGNAPSLSVGPLRLLLLASVDHDFAQLLGLATVDPSAAVEGLFGERFDYKVVGYWAGPEREVLDCGFLPGGGAVVAGQDLGLLTVPSGSEWRFVAVDAGALAPADEVQHLSATFHLDKPVDVVRISGAAGGEQPLKAVALAGDTVVAEGSSVPGATAHVTLNGARITSVVVTGDGLRIDGVCRVVVEPLLLTYQWICFDVGIDVVPDPDPPRQLSGVVAPGFARSGGSEQVIEITVEPRPVDPLPWELLPLVRLALDPVEYDLLRRADGDAPLGGPDVGVWVAIPTDDSGQPAPILRNTFRPDLHKSPEGWPVPLADFIDGTLDPGVRFYSYRARARDVFGRTSVWSDAISVDAADHVAPPPPAFVRARWIETGDPRCTIDDLALLQARELQHAVRLRWSWPDNLRRQAPDSATFRTYWNSAGFVSIAGTIVRVASFGSEHLLTFVTPALISAPPVDAFVGDWLRQGSKQYLVNASWQTSPLTMRVIGVDVHPPQTGDGYLTIRRPDAQRLDMLGNPLQTDSTRAEAWQRREHQGPLLTIDSDVLQQIQGIPVSIAQVANDQPRPGMAIVSVTPDWRWSDVDASSFKLVAAGVTYTVLGGTLGTEMGVVLVDTSNDAPPRPGPAALVGAQQLVGTLVTNLRQTDLPATDPFRIVGGTAVLTPLVPDAAGIALPAAPAADGPVSVSVVAHRLVDVLELAVTPASPAAAFNWYPDYETLLTDADLAVDEFHPTATGVTGVSAVDSRAYVADRRQVAGEPTGPGNEGPVESISVQRVYHQAPTQRPAPDGTQGANPLWAPVPEPFSGISRYLLRWQTDGASRFVVLHATLDAVLDAAQADPAVPRTAQELRALAVAQPSAFAPLTTTPLSAVDPLLVDSQGPPWLRWIAPLDGRAPGTHFLRVDCVDAAGNRGPAGDVTLPIVVPDPRRPLTPSPRRSVDGDRGIWIEWDAADQRVDEYWVYRTQSPVGTRRDVRDMQHLVTLAADQCPQPLAVFSGSIRLPGAQPQAIVAVYQAEVYDPTQPADNQAAPIDGPFTLAGNTLSGVGLPDGSLVHAVVRFVVAGPASLASPPNGRAFHDTSVSVNLPYQYRVDAVRTAQIGQTVTLAVHSYPSDVLEGTAFDPRPPDPPQATATWRPAEGLVRINWATAGLPAGLDVLAQRTLVGNQLWQNVATWVSATVGEVVDQGVQRRRSYFYRVRARNALGRVSAFEATFGPVDTV